MPPCLHTAPVSSSTPIRHVFGVKVNVPNSLHFAEDGTVVFPVGHNVVKHNVETRGQEFLNASESSLAISCVTVSPSKRYL